jgi:tetratricopeptide (TPR) repeat protein
MNLPFVPSPARATLLALCLTVSGIGLPALGAPFTPTADSDVVERLPGRTGDDPAIRRVESMRRQLASKPQDIRLRTEIARRYFDLAMAQGDPRYVGYAIGTIAVLAAQPPQETSYWQVRGMLEQYNHDFERALTSLARAAEIDPSQPDPPGWRAAIFMVQARYDEARAECAKLAALAHPLWSAGCLAYAQAAQGGLKPAYEQLVRATATASEVPVPLRLWTETRLAEMAVRLGRPEAATQHFQRALDTGLTDQFLLGAYADFLLAQGRSSHVITLLANWERSDILLLRLALAGRATQDPRAKDWAQQLRDRFEASARRSDRLHEWEAAVFELQIESRPERALQLAMQNYTSQREPRDALMLMRTALAAKRPRDAAPALAWLRASGYEDPVIADMARQLQAAGGSK